VRIEGREAVSVPRAEAWRALDDPEVLRACTPGMTRLEETRPDHYEAVLELKLPAISGRFEGHVDVVERVEPERMKLRIDAKGGPGFVTGEAELHLEETEGGTAVRYAADLQIGGQVARLGQRMISGVTKEMAGQFFEAFEAAAAAGGEVAAPPQKSAIAAFFQLAWRTLLNLLGLSRRSG
jgi:carbon monoxide dehydrogenase subunit G